MGIFLTIAALVTYDYEAEQENFKSFAQEQQQEQQEEKRVRFDAQTNVGPTNMEDRVKDTPPLFPLSEKEINIRVILDRVFTGNRKEDIEAVRGQFGKKSFDEDDRSILTNYWNELVKKKRIRDVVNIKINEEIEAEENSG